MELAFLVYAIGLLHKFSLLLIVIVTVCLGTLFILNAFTRTDATTKLNYSNAVERTTAKETIAFVNTNTKRLLITLAIAAGLLTAIPTERTAYIMVGAYATQTIATHPSTLETRDKVLKLINLKLDELTK